jgi:glucose-6-phosphate 1-dehydrogenase
MKSTLKSQPVIFIIFGGTGDLNLRKITPALYNLFCDDWLPDQFVIVGTARTKLTDDEFRDRLLEGVNQFSRNGKADQNKWAEFASHVSYQAADLNEE